MFARLRSVWSAINASYWFYPAVFAIGSFVLALVLVHLDRNGAAEWISRVSILHPARPDGASNMLTVLAGSMIGVASTVFSITIAAVAYASGTYGPRLLTNFMEDKGNQLSLATFIGTFVYSITVLRTVRAEDEAPIFGGGSDAAPGFVPQLSLLVGFGLMVIAVGVLVYFLHHIPSSIRINSVLEEIGRHLLRKIRDRFPDENAGSEPHPDAPDGAIIRSHSTGYIRFIGLEELYEVADRKGVRIGLQVRTGDFVQRGKPVARVDGDSVDEDIADAVRGCFALGASRTPEQDLEFLIDELVEIALRALSPGINDPFTAITALHWLGAATTELGSRSLSQRFDDGERAERVVPLNDDFDHFLERGFGAVRSAVSSNRLSALVALDTLAGVALSLDDETRKAHLVREAARLVEQAETTLKGPDIQEVRARHISTIEPIAHALGA